MSSITLGKHIQQLRQDKGMTQQQLCERTGLSYSTLAKIERGAIKSPSVFTISAIARELGSTLENVMSLRVEERSARALDLLVKPEDDTQDSRKSVGPRLHGDDAPARALGPGLRRDDTQSVKFVYFDIHGVLLHFYEQGFMRLAEEAGVNVELVENTFWHYNDSACRGEMTIHQFNQAMAQRIGVKEVDWAKYYFDAVEPIKAMQDLLIDASKKYRVGLLSNIFPGFLDENIKRGILPNINYDVIIDSAKVHAIKPEQEIFDIAEKRAKAKGAEILFIDDSRNYIMAAEKLNWRVMWCDDFRPEESARRVRHALGL
jgi:putative hydrolase of the HAD superfamily